MHGNGSRPADDLASLARSRISSRSRLLSAAAAAAGHNLSVHAPRPCCMPFSLAVDGRPARAQLPTRAGAAKAGAASHSLTRSPNAPDASRWRPHALQEVCNCMHACRRHGPQQLRDVRRRSVWARGEPYVHILRADGSVFVSFPSFMDLHDDDVSFERDFARGHNLCGW